ncbi:MAG: hypothetical protein J6B30_05645 [Muribaculaceae bacterium]|nr:hypothetical protein [Muribaculaceae bacterium]
MKQLKDIFKNPKLYIILFLLLTGAFFYLRSVNRELIYIDEIIYGYNLNATEYGEYWSSPQTSLFGKIETISDVIDSQKNHYFHGNGRSIVHGIQQLFTGVLNVNVFYVVNTFIFSFIVVCILKLLKITNKYGYILIVVLALLYLFPMPYRLWYSINMSCNYLWPMCFTLVFLDYCTMINANMNFSKFALTNISILGFIAGWSHEAYSIPLSGALFFYIIFNFKKVNKKLLYVAIPLWIGTCIMVFAPANIARFFGGTGDSSKIYAVANAIDNFMHLKLLWIFVVALIAFRISNYKYLKNCLSENKLFLYALIIGILFGFVANTAPYSFTAIELFSLLLTMKLLIPKIENYKIKKVYLIIVTIIFIVHQSMIVNGEIQQSTAQRNLISEYVKSEDGVVNYNIPITSWYIKPYVTIWKHSDVSVLYGGTIEFAYGNGQKMYALGDSDYKFVSNKNSYVKENKFNGTAPFYYDGGKAFWAKASNVDSTDVFEFEFEPVSFSYDVPLLLKLKFAISPEGYSQKEVAEKKFIKTRWGDYYYILYPPVRKPVSINYVKK